MLEILLKSVDVEECGIGEESGLEECGLGGLGRKGWWKTKVSGCLEGKSLQQVFSY